MECRWVETSLPERTAEVATDQMPCSLPGTSRGSWLGLDLERGGGTPLGNGEGRGAKGWVQTLDSDAQESKSPAPWHGVG